MIITGRNPVFEALAAGKARKVIVRKGASVHFENVTASFEVLGKSVFEEIYGEETQGVAAVVDDFRYRSFEENICELKKTKGVVFLDKIQDPHNFGALIRAAHCFGIKSLIVPRHDQAKVTAAVYRASAGAIFYTDIIEVVNLGQAVDALKKEGFTIAAAETRGGEPLKDVKNRVKYPLGVVIGSEGKGIRESLVNRADVRVTIPLAGKIDSLNAAMSGAVIFYELFGRETISEHSNE